MEAGRLVEAEGHRQKVAEVEQHLRRIVESGRLGCPEVLAVRPVGLREAREVVPFLELQSRIQSSQDNCCSLTGHYPDWAGAKEQLREQMSHHRSSGRHNNRLLGGLCHGCHVRAKEPHHLHYYRRRLRDHDRHCGSAMEQPRPLDRVAKVCCRRCRCRYCCCKGLVRLRCEQAARWNLRQALASIANR